MLDLRAVKRNHTCSLKMSPYAICNFDLDSMLQPWTGLNVPWQFTWDVDVHMNLFPHRSWLRLWLDADVRQLLGHCPQSILLTVKDM